MKTKSINLEVKESDATLSVSMIIEGFNSFEVIGILHLQIADVLKSLNNKDMLSTEQNKFPNGGNFEA